MKMIMKTEVGVQTDGNFFLALCLIYICFSALLQWQILLRSTG